MPMAGPSMALVNCEPMLIQAASSVETLNSLATVGMSRPSSVPFICETSDGQVKMHQPHAETHRQTHRIEHVVDHDQPDDAAAPAAAAALVPHRRLHLRLRHACG